MTIGAVTARSHGGLRPANQNFAPSTAKLFNLRSTAGRVSTHGLATIGSQVQKKALASIAATVTRTALVTVARSTPLSFGAVIAVEYLYSKVVAPDGFPGFDNINEGWRDPEAPNGKSPGDYVGNLFDIGPNAPPPSRVLLDADDTVGFSIRYWGDFGADPYPTPLPGTNWPTKPIWLPNPDAAPQVRPRPAYRPLRDLSPKRNQSRRRQGRFNRSNFMIRIDLHGVRGRKAPELTFRENVPNKRDRSDKAAPANQFIYFVLLELANALGEVKEWTDILAEAAGYRRGEHSGPASIQRGHETVAKAWWLFVDGGINNIDFGALAVLVVENEAEDRLFGFFGRLGKAASRSLGLTVGVQAGPVI